MRRAATLLLSSLLIGTAATQPSVEIVLARCRENIDWVDEMGYGGITTVYDKCKVTSGPGRHVVRANLGRESGTYLQHIVDNYDTLADWTVFTQAEKPTYGYRGHRLGGGHMMRNVLFQDYVEAAKTREANPRFFIYTSVLVSNKEHVYQCIRNGYGEEYTKPTEEAFGKMMCGMVDDWKQWYEFPQWFTDMLQRLQQEQSAPLTTFDVARAFEIFNIQPTQGVTFFAQGARFAASREAIQARPKSYYEGILEHLQTQDPWAGYYLEWMWYYVLGGTNAPCGFEEPVLHGHLSWERTAKGREQQQLQAVSGEVVVVPTLNATSGVNVISGSKTVTEQTVLSEPETRLIIESGVLTFLAEFIFESTGGSITGDTLNLGAGGTIAATLVALRSLVVSAQAIVEAKLEIAAELVLNGGAQIEARNGGNVKGELKGKGNFLIKGKGALMVFLNVLIKSLDIQLNVGDSGTGRRERVLSDISGLIQWAPCGMDSVAPTTVSTGSVVINDLTCTVASNTAFSNIYGQVTGAGGMLLFTSIAPGVRPVYMAGITNPQNLKTEFSTGSNTNGFCQDVVAYSTSSCSLGSLGWNPNCTNACSLKVNSESKYANANCVVQFCQNVPGAGTDNNGGLYGLIALVAIIPLAGLIGWGAWYYFKGGETAAVAAPEAYNQYYYPEPYPRAAYPAYPQYAPYGAEAYPFQGGFYDAGARAPVPTPVGFASL